MEGDLLLSFSMIVEGLWFSMRIAGLWIALPVFGSGVLPVRLRLLLTVSCTILMMMALRGQVDIPDSNTPAFWLGAVREFVIGLMLGFVLRLAFEAMLLGAELISLAMGLGFAQMNDPLRGTSAPVLGSLFSTTVTLVFLTLEGHLRIVEWLAWSYTLPAALVGEELHGGILQWSGWVFVHAVQVAIPALISLLIVNIGFGVISRSAPSLNLLAVGFPAALLLGLVVLLIMAPALVAKSEVAIGAALGLVADTLN